MTAIDPAIFRPSALPKLAECIHYEPIPGDAGPAAQRGTRIDTLFRALMAGENPPASADDEMAVAHAAVEMARRIVGDNPVLTRDADCKITVTDSEFQQVLTGTLDLICPTLRLSADLKTGEMRSYHAQMAAYALGCMDRFGCDEWTTVLIFVDQGGAPETRWTYEQASGIVLGLRDRWVDRGEHEPTPCDYCGWCNRGLSGKADCPAVARQLIPVAELLPLPSDLEQAKAVLLSDQVKAGQFKRAMKLAEALLEAVDAKAKKGEGWCPEGYRLQPRKGALRVDATKLDAIARDVGTAKVFDCCTVNAGKLKKLLADFSPEVERRYADAFFEGKPVMALVEEKKP